MNDEQRENIATLLQAMGVCPYNQAPTARAGAAVWAEYVERELWGRSHYYDAGTRKFFGCRVHEASVLLGGAYLLTIESVTPPECNGGRRYRPVLFGPTGEVTRLGVREPYMSRLGDLPELHCKPALDGNGWATLEGARQAVRAWRGQGHGCDSTLWDYLLRLAATHAQRSRQRADVLTDTLASVPRFFYDMKS